MKLYKMDDNTRDLLIQELKKKILQSQDKIKQLEIKLQKVTNG